MGLCRMIERVSVGQGEAYMFKVAIVEDDRVASDTLKEYIERFAAEKNEKIEAEVFEDGLKFKRHRDRKEAAGNR